MSLIQMDIEGHNIMIPSPSNNLKTSLSSLSHLFREVAFHIDRSFIHRKIDLDNLKFLLDQVVINVTKFKNDLPQKRQSFKTKKG
jgi:hypothetical protein